MTIDVRHDRAGLTLAADMLLAVADLNDALARSQAHGVAPFAGPLQIDPITTPSADESPSSSTMSERSSS